jgi:hypothetical protein
MIITSSLLSFGLIYNERPANSITSKYKINIYGQAYISEWETGNEWHSSSDDLYYIKKSIPQLDQQSLTNGMVLTYIKGYNFSNLPMTEKPISLPFQYFSPDDSETKAVTWQMEKSKGEIQVGVQLSRGLMNTFSQFKKNIQLRYFILTPEFLDKHQLTKEKLCNISYSQIIALTKVKP